MTDIQKLKALAEGCRDEVIRSHGWAGMIEDADLLRRDEAFLKECSPDVVLELIAEIERLSERMKIVDFVHGPKAEMHWNQLKAENEALRKDAVRWQFIRDVWPKVKLVPNGDWFNSCFLEREIDAAMSKESSHD